MPDFYAGGAFQKLNLSTVAKKYQNRVSDISIGNTHICFISNGGVICSGFNTYGGLGTDAPIYDLELKPPALALLPKFQEAETLAVGEYYTVISTKTGQVFSEFGTSSVVVVLWLCIRSMQGCIWLQLQIFDIWVRIFRFV